MTPEAGGSSPPSRALYVVGRADLPPGLRAAQLAHGALAWAAEHGPPPDNLVLLDAPDEAALWALAERLPGRVQRFHEPDLGGELTAVAVEGPEARRQLSSLPLALKRRP